MLRAAPGAGRADSRGRLSLHLLKLDWKLLGVREVVLFAAYLAVVFGGHFEELEPAVGGQEAALIAERLHFVIGKRLEINRDS